MNNKINIGFIYDNDTWLGGKKYLENLIRSLVFLKKFNIFLITGNKQINLNVNNINIIQTNLVKKKNFLYLLRRFVKKFLKKDFILEYFLIYKKIDILSHSGIIGENSKITCIPWIPDFQHHHLRKFFTDKEYFSRENEFLEYAKYGDKIIVSCEHAKKVLKKRYNFAKKKSVVLNYRIFKKNNFLKKNKNLSNFFFVPNQFWIHKNHNLILEALKLDKNKNNIKIIFTGPTSDHRFPKYFNTLMEKINSNKFLKKNIQYLGLVSEKKLASLFNNCVAVINPSFYEGWNTGVEEAHYNGKITIVSRLPVHLEQNLGHSYIFNKNNPKELLNCIINVIKKKKKLNKEKKIIKKKYDNSYDDYFKKLINIYSF